MTADIEKAYLESNVAEKHRNYLRCIWLKNEMFLPKYQKYASYVFAAPSQLLLNGTVKMMANNYKKADPEFVEKIRRSFYVDDLCSAASDSQRGYEGKAEVFGITQDCG